MNNLLKVEWLKMRKYNAFWWIMGITALSYPGINYIFYSSYQDIIQKHNTAGKLARTFIGNPYAFPEGWHTVSYFSSWFVFIPAVVVIMFISNEYTFKTSRQNIIDGWSRNQFMTAKLVDVLIVTLVITLLNALVALILGLSSPASEELNPAGRLYYIGLFSLQTFSQLSIAFLIGFLVKKAFIALGIFLFYFIALENILVGLFRVYAHDIGRYLPLEMSDRLIPVPAFLGRLDQERYDTVMAQVQPHIFYTVLLTAAIWLICFRVNSRKDL